MPTIISGKRRGAKLSVPDGLGVRPTLARVREALFSMITSAAGSFESKCVLDPFAGAGLLGLEAWSRGAAHVDMMEMSRTHFDILKKNIEHLRAGNDITCLCGQSPRDWMRFGNRMYDIVMCDPPYAADLLPSALSTLHAEKRLKPNAIVSIESDGGDFPAIPDCFAEIRDRLYGRCRIMILKYCPESMQK